MSKRYTIEELESSGVALCPVPGVVGCAVGSDGRVYSFRMPGRGRVTHRTTCYPMADRPNSDGYLNVAVQWRGRRQDISVSRLVATVFHGERPEVMQCSHLDGDKTNNRPENLVYESCGDNIRRKRVHGTMARGERHGISKLCEDDVRYIRKRHEESVSQDDIAWDLGIAQSTVSAVIRRQTWRHVD